MATDKALVLLSGTANQIPVTDFLDPGAGVAFPNGSAAAPSAYWNTNYGIAYDSTNSALGFSAAGVQTLRIDANGWRCQQAGGATVQGVLVGDGVVQEIFREYSNNTTAPTVDMGKARGTRAAPAIAQLGDAIGTLLSRPCVDASGTGTFALGAAIYATLIETGTVSASAFGTQFELHTTPIGGSVLAAVARFNSQYQAFTGPTKIGAVSAPATSTILDLVSTTGALGLPSMTTTQKNALTAANRMAVYDSTLDKFQFYQAGAWVNLGVSALTNGHILVGNSSNVPADVPMSGDTTIDNTGAVAVGGVAVAGIAYVASGYTQSRTGGATAQSVVSGEGVVNYNIRRYSADATNANFTMGKARGTIASPAVPITGDVLGGFQFQALTAVTPTFTTGADFRAVLTETSAVDSTHVGSRFLWRACPIGSGTLTEVARLDNETGLSMFGANPVIDQNRTHILNSSTVAGLPANVTGGLRYVSDLEGGQGVTIGGATLTRDIATGAIAQATVSGRGIITKFTGYCDYKYRALIQDTMQKLKDAGLLTKLLGLWVHAVPTNSTDALLNWITPGTRNMAIVGTIGSAWTANQGFTGNGSDLILATGASPTTFGASVNSIALGTYIRTASASAATVFGNSTGVARRAYMQSRTSGAITARLSDTTDDTFTPAKYTGMFVLNRTVSTGYNWSVDDTAPATITRTSTTVPGGLLCFLGTADATASEFSTAELSFSFVATGLTTADIANLRWIMVDNYLVQVGAIAADYTVATLPLAATPPKGSQLFIADGLTPVFAAAAVGGGAVYTPVYTDLTNWRCGGGR